MVRERVVPEVSRSSAWTLKGITGSTQGMKLSNIPAQNAAAI